MLREVLREIETLSVLVQLLGNRSRRYLADMDKNFLRSETLGTIGCDCLYYDLRTGKKYVGVHCLIDIKEIEKSLDAI
jgi:hypothetical protein